MIDDEIVLKIERLRDDTETLRQTLKDQYPRKESGVKKDSIRIQASQIAERWLVEVANNQALVAAIGENLAADISVEYQRLLTYSDQTVIRKKYDHSLKLILKKFRSDVIVPLKQLRGFSTVPALHAHDTIFTSRRNLQVFVGQSFSSEDKKINDTVFRFLEAMGFTVTTGEKPKADTISSKVRARIDAAPIFVGIFTKRDKIARRNEWTTSAWVIDEKAYAIAKSKKLILIKETGVQSIGGLQGDYEYLSFDRDDLAEVLIKLVQVC